jgi:hypothetical protein
MDEELKLPPLPRLPSAVLDWLPPGMRSETREWARSYARVALLAERERIAAQWEYQHGFDKYGVAAAIRGHAEEKQ